MKRKRIIGSFLLVSLLATSMILSAHADNTYAVATPVEEICSANSTSGDYFKAETPLEEDNILRISGHTSITTELFRIALHPCQAEGSNVMNVFVEPDSNGDFSVTVDLTEGNSSDPVATKGNLTICSGSKPGSSQAVPAMEAGFYRLRITRAVTEEQADTSEWWLGHLGGEYGFVWREVVLQVTENNNPKLVTFESVLSQQIAVHKIGEPSSETIAGYDGSYVRYLDPSLSDVTYLLDDPITGEVSELTDEHLAQIRGIAEGIVAGETSSYEKAKKIYAYVAENFYYDNLAHRTGERQYAHPYENLMDLLNERESANSTGGKVATLCHGYAAMVVALCRSVEIPARTVYGIHLASTTESWATNEDFVEPTHWWAEVFVNDKWITVDANLGSLNAWERSDWDDAGTWMQGSGITYSGFDMSDKALCGTYLIQGIDRGDRDGKYLCYINEVDQLKAFLNTSNGTSTNGLVMNSEYSESDIKTWGTGEEGKLMGDGYGRAYQIQWPDLALTGVIDLRGFSGLKYLSLYDNDITGVYLADCSSLESAALSYNQISEFDSTDSNNLKYINLKNNPLTRAAFCIETQEVTITGEGGTFSFEYDITGTTPLIIHAGAAPEGYVLEGIYDSNGNIAATSGTAFVPEDTEYTVKFRDNTSERIPAPAATVTNNQNGKLSVAWEAVEGAVSYDIYRSTEVEGPFTTRWTNTTNTTYTPDTEFGVTYYYKIRAISDNPDHNSLLSATVEGVRVLPSPEWLDSTDTVVAEPSGTMKLSWNPVEQAVSYTIYRKEATNTTFQSVATVTATTWCDEDLTPGILYDYCLVANYSDPELNSVPGYTRSRTAKCAQPTVTVTLDETTGKPLISWDPVEGAGVYWVQRSEDGEVYETIKSIPSPDTSFLNEYAVGGTTYYYRVKVKCAIGDGAGNSVESEAHSITCAKEVVAPTIASKIDEASGSVVINWTKITGATQYYIYRSLTTEGPFEQYASTSAVSFMDEDTTPGVCYYYRVKTYSEGRLSDFSNLTYITCDCASPVVTAENDGDSGRIILNWDPIAGASKYYIYRYNSETGTYDYYRSATETTFTDKDSEAVPGTEYSYKVRALCDTNTAGHSAQSASVSAIFDCARPVVTIDVDADSGRLVLDWNDVDGAGKYYIYRYDSSSKSYKYHGTSTSSAYTDKEGIPGTKHYYKVRAVCGKSTSGNSVQSVSVNAICDCARPQVTIKTYTTTGNIALSWGAVDGASKYYIYRYDSATKAYKYYKSTTKTTYTDTDTVPGYKYYYKVKAICGKSSYGNSVQSTSVSIIRDCARPVISITRSSGKPKISWSAVDGANKYYIYRYSSSAKEYKYYKSTTKITYTDTDAVSGYKYYYKVKAVCKNSSYGNSALSTSKSITAK